MGRLLTIYQRRASDIVDTWDGVRSVEVMAFGGEAHLTRHMICLSCLEVPRLDHELLVCECGGQSDFVGLGRILARVGRAEFLEHMSRYVAVCCRNLGAEH